jgi:transposase
MKIASWSPCPEVWTPDERTRVLRRRITRRAQLVRQRTREKNQVHAILIPLKGRSPASDLFGAAGRRWLAAQELPVDEREMLEACLRGIDFLDREVTAIDRTLAELVLASPELRRLLTLPGVNSGTACALLAAIGDIRRFPTARHLVGYLGLDPRVRPSGSEPARHGRISKQGPGETRHVLVEAAWHAARTSGPLLAFHERVAARHGRNIATVAVARKLAVVAWHMLSRGEVRRTPLDQDQEPRLTGVTRWSARAPSSVAVSGSSSRPKAFDMHQAATGAGAYVKDEA